MTSSWAAQKQSRPHTFSSISPICINTHGQYTTPTCPKCAYKISQIFSRVFEFTLLNFAQNPRKLMCREYFHSYSILSRALVCQWLVQYMYVDIMSFLPVALNMCMLIFLLFMSLGLSQLWVASGIFLEVLNSISRISDPLAINCVILFFYFSLDVYSKMMVDSVEKVIKAGKVGD